VLISWSGSFVVPLLFTAAVGLVFGCGGFGLVVNNLDREIGESESQPTQRPADGSLQPAASPRLA